MSSDIPEFSNENLDFSQYHPLDHKIASSRCFRFFGGPRQHFKLEWEYIRLPKLRAMTACRMGVHDYVMVTKYKDGKPTHSFERCVNCGKRK